MDGIAKQLLNISGLKVFFWSLISFGVYFSTKFKNMKVKLKGGWAPKTWALTDIFSMILLTTVGLFPNTTLFLCPWKPHSSHSASLSLPLASISMIGIRIGGIAQINFICHVPGMGFGHFRESPADAREFALPENDKRSCMNFTCSCFFLTFTCWESSGQSTR